VVSPMGAARPSVLPSFCQDPRDGFLSIFVFSRIGCGGVVTTVAVVSMIGVVDVLYRELKFWAVAEVRVRGVPSAAQSRKGTTVGGRGKNPQKILDARANIVYTLRMRTAWQTYWYVAWLAIAAYIAML
jgi:hypothetical protein